MNEKIYKTMSAAGISNLAVGIIVLATGIASGTLLIIQGAKLLKRKSDILL